MLGWTAAHTGHVVRVGGPKGYPSGSNGKRGGLMTVAVVAAVRSELRYIPVSFRASGRV